MITLNFLWPGLLPPFSLRPFTGNSISSPGSTTLVYLLIPCLCAGSLVSNIDRILFHSQSQSVWLTKNKGTEGLFFALNSWLQTTLAAQRLENGVSKVCRIFPLKTMKMCTIYCANQFSQVILLNLKKKNKTAKTMIYRCILTKFSRGHGGKC